MSAASGRDQAVRDAAKASVTARFQGARRCVIKVGSAVIAPDAVPPSADRLAGIAADIAALRARNCQVVVVSSGAVAAGRGLLGLARPTSLAEKQAAAAAGQPLLMRAWGEALAEHHVTVAQALLTSDDTEVRRRWLNARATLDMLLAHGVIPIVNENDTVATSELRYGDNDRLAARVAQLVGADALVLLSDIDGLYSADPRTDASARRIDYVAAVTPQIEALAGGAAPGGVGTGGMATKLVAARLAAAAGCVTVLTSGRTARPLEALSGGGAATWFDAAESPESARKQWISGALAARGALHLDAGAARALAGGASLLPAGVVGVEGDFEKGDAVRILADGAEVARGLVAYAAADARAIKGLRSDAAAARLGWVGPAALVHRNDMVMSEARDRAGARQAAPEPGEEDGA